MSAAIACASSAIHCAIHSAIHSALHSALHLLFEILKLALALVDRAHLLLHLLITRRHERLEALALLHRLAQPVHANLVLVHARAKLDDDVLTLGELLGELRSGRSGEIAARSRRDQARPHAARRTFQ